jgi:hypothetical protein
MELSAQLVHEPKQAKCCNHALIPICNTPTTELENFSAFFLLFSEEQNSPNPYGA